MITKNYNTFEERIEQIGQEVIGKKSLPEYKDVHEKEIVKEIIAPLIKGAPDNKLIDEVKGGANDENLPEYLEKESSETKAKVEELINNVKKNGDIEKTASHAWKYGAYFVDAFHDALAHKIHEDLEEKKSKGI